MAGFEHISDAGLLNGAAELAGEQMYTGTKLVLDLVAQSCESPIEARMLGHLALKATRHLGGGFVFDSLRRIGTWKDVATAMQAGLRFGSPRSRTGSLWLGAQVNVGNYRVDLVAARDDGYVQFVFVECDGHNYHERKREQAERDRKRDRWMVAEGFTVLRFTGSEIHQRGDECALEVLNVLGVDTAERT